MENQRAAPCGKLETATRLGWGGTTQHPHISLGQADSCCWAPSSRSLQELSNVAKCYCSCSWCCICFPSVAPEADSFHGCTLTPALSCCDGSSDTKTQGLQSITLFDQFLAGHSLDCWTLGWACHNLSHRTGTTYLSWAWAPTVNIDFWTTQSSNMPFPRMPAWLYTSSL